jgi:hypothetical protein
MSGGIYLLRDGDELVEMHEQPYDSEAVLQELLAKHPNLLAGDQLGGVPRRWLHVDREQPVPAEEGSGGRWSLDHLFLDQDAVPTLVEVKRSSDTRIRREVVGQMLDYAANAVVYWTIERLRATLETAAQAKGLNPDAEVAALLDEEGATDAFWEKANTNLRAGKVRLVFVADQVPPELRRVIEFLNEQMNPAEVIGIEVRQYVGEGLKTLVPRIVGQTAEAQQRKGRGATRDWSWEEYEQELGIPPDRLATAKACFENIRDAITQRGLPWQPKFRNGYLGFNRPGDYNTVTVELRTRAPLVAVKLPDPPESLGLKNPYPRLTQNWDAHNRQWGWFVPDVASVPDFGLAIDISRPHQPETGPMRPPTVEVAAADDASLDNALNTVHRIGRRSDGG